MNWSNVNVPALNSMFDAMVASRPQKGAKVVYFPGKKRAIKGELASGPLDPAVIKLETGETVKPAQHLCGKVNYIGGWRTETEYALWLKDKSRF